VKLQSSSVANRALRLIWPMSQSVCRNGPFEPPSPPIAPDDRMRKAAKELAIVTGVLLSIALAIGSYSISRLWTGHSRF
jgi:hypothetical protein